MTTKAQATARKNAIESKLKALTQKQAELKAERDKAARIIKSTETTSRRKMRNRALTLLGIIIEADLKAGSSFEPLVNEAKRLLKPSEAEFLEAWLNNNLEKPQ